MLVELLISIVMLTVGLGALMILLMTAIYTNSRSAKDTTSTMVAEHVLEQISAVPADASNVIQLADCANNTWSIATTGAALGAGSGANGGNGSDLTASGNVDWTQSYASVPANYKMQFTGCGNGGRQTVYDVRWNVINMTTNPVATNYSRMVVVSARPLNTTQQGGLRFALPANLRTIAGM
jgi:type II secretory pathway pseudopilin PulG